MLLKHAKAKHLYIPPSNFQVGHVLLSPRVELGVERIWSTGSETFLFLVHVLFVAFDLASLAFQSQRRFEHVPQWFGTGLTVGRKVVE